MLLPEIIYRILHACSCKRVGTRDKTRVSAEHCIILRKVFNKLSNTGARMYESYGIKITLKSYFGREKVNNVTSTLILDVQSLPEPDQTP